MAGMDKSVYICFRRSNLMRALALSQKLSAEGYSVYFDHRDSSGAEAEQANLNQIKARPHFLLILTPTALDSCEAPDDPMRREIEAALDGRHNIICLMYDGANIKQPFLAIHLIGKLEGLMHCTNLAVSTDNFGETIQALRSYLNEPVIPLPLRPTTGPLTMKAEGENEITEKSRVQGEHPALSAQDWFDRGELAVDLDEKIHCYSEAIHLRPGFAIAFNNRGKAYADKGLINNAIDDLTEAIRLEPDYAIAYNNRGSALTTKGDYDAAIRDCNEAILREQNFSKAYNNLGAAYHRKGELDEAIKNYTYALELDTESYEAYANRGSAFHNKGDLKSAFMDSTESIRIKPDFAMAYHNRASVRFDVNDFDGAVKDCTKAIELEPHSPSTYRSRAYVFIKKADYLSAVSDLKQYLELGGGMQNGDQAQIEYLINTLQAKV